MKILVVDDEIEYASLIKKILIKKGYDVDISLDAMDAIEIIKSDSTYNVILSDLIMGKMNGIEFLDEVKKINKDIIFILITGYGSIENAVCAMKKGAHSYFVKGDKIEKLITELNNIKVKSVDTYSDKEFKLITKNKKFEEVLNLASKVAKTDTNILILGESGVGKDVLAKYIHKMSLRFNNDFIPVNCCSFSDNLLESELFGHEKGAFTGANNLRRGRFEYANKGTLFLDEIGDVSHDIQVKLLRTLENRTIERIGSNKTIDLDFRLISATNKDFKEEIKIGKIREDFFYRISTITLTIPPLRDRKEDLRDLIDLFIDKYNKKYNKNVILSDLECMNILLNYDYPGNIRELKSIINRLVILCDKDNISKTDLYIADNNLFDNIDKVDDKLLSKDIKPLKEVRKEFESEYIKSVLNSCGNNISHTAKKLDISRRQLTNKINEYRIK